MALQVLRAHTGHRHVTDPSIFTSLDDLKGWIATQDDEVPAVNLIALTTEGRAVKFETLHKEQEICIYDRRIVQQSSVHQEAVRQHISFIPLPAAYDPPNAPENIQPADPSAWRKLFVARRNWAQLIVEGCEGMLDQAQARYDEIDVMMRCVDAAVINYERHVKALEQKGIELQKWATSITDQDRDKQAWDVSISLVQSIPVSKEILQLLTQRNFRDDGSLIDLFDVEKAHEALKVARQATSEVDRRSKDLASKVDNVLLQTHRLYDKIETSPAHEAISRASEIEQLMHDIQAILNKIQTDSDAIISQQKPPTDPTQAAKVSQLHVRNFVPNLIQRSREMYGMSYRAAETRNVVASGSLDIMQGIASLTTMLGNTTKEIEALELGQSGAEAIQLMTALQNAPLLLASFLAESLKRQRWNDRVKADVSSLRDDMAAGREEEAKRRRKWQRSTGTAIWGSRVDTKVAEPEFSLREEVDAWPVTSMQDMENLLRALRAGDADQAMQQQVTDIMRALEAPPKQHAKRTNTFKAGSIHEAVLSRSGLLRADDDLVQSLQTEKNKVESKLKTAESRVRRLEDLLHRQGQSARNVTGNLFHPSPIPDPAQAQPAMTSPRIGEDRSRRSSVSSRRYSANTSNEDKASQQRLLVLEAELLAERERSSVLEKDVAAQRKANEEILSQIAEAKTIKEDLLGNFDAQQREFAGERKSLESEITRLKGKLEEVEDELDRYAGSRENEKAGVDERIQNLQEQLASLHKTSRTELQRAQGQVDFLRNDAKLHRETNDSMAKQLQRAQADLSKIQIEMGTSRAANENYQRYLSDLHGQVLPGRHCPSGPTAMFETLQAAWTDHRTNLDALQAENAMAKSDAREVRARLEEARGTALQSTSKLDTTEAEVRKLRDALAAEEARFAALEGQLVDERYQLSQVRQQLSHGQTGSDVLSQRLEHEERKSTALAEDLALSNTRVGSLEAELGLLSTKLAQQQNEHSKLDQRFELRTSRLKDLSQRVYMQNERLCRLLERFGYAITRSTTGMTVQRLARADRSITSSANTSDPSEPGLSLSRTTASQPTRKGSADSKELESLNWPHAADEFTETMQYDAYMKVIGSFDIDTFSDTVSKRIKDVEYTAKKYSRDSRTYREKYSMLYKEAHEKIAYRHFKEGDLALFLPTRNQVSGAWAAFNVGAPHYFLREQDAHKLRSREWLLARVNRIEERIVDLSRPAAARVALSLDNKSLDSTSNTIDSYDDENPFDLSDGLRWYLVDATEEKAGAPTTPGLGKSTVAAANIAATADIRRLRQTSGDGVDDIGKTLSKSLESRRSSTHSKRGVQAPGSAAKGPRSPVIGSPAKPEGSLLGVSGASPATAFARDIAGADERRPQSTVVDRHSDDVATALPVAAGSEGTVGRGTDEVQPSSPPRAQPIATSSPARSSLLWKKPSISTNTSTVAPTAQRNTSPSKRSIIWDSLWSLDYGSESAKARKE